MNIRKRIFIPMISLTVGCSVVALGDNDSDKIVSTAIALHTMAQLDYCTILDGEGIVYTRTHDPGYYGDSIAHLPHIRSALAGKTEAHIIQGPIVRLGVSGGAPVYDESGNIVGLVSLGFRLDTQRFVNNLKALTGCEITFFLGAERVSTTLLNPDGTYALGMKAPNGIIERVLAGEEYAGRAQLIGRDAYTKYQSGNTGFT